LLLIALLSQSQLVLQDHLSNLSDLVGFGLSAPGLQIEDFLNTSLAEYVMIASDSPGESEVF
jgi:hypothetical protein